MSSKHTVYVLNPYHEDAIALLQSAPDINLVLPSDPRQESHPWQQHSDAVLLRSETRITAEDFAKIKEFGRLRFIAKQGVGVDNIDIDAAWEASVQVYNTPGVNSEAVAEFSLAMALSLSRRVTEMDRRIRRGEKVVRSDMLGISLLHKKVGIIGMGNVGRAAARKWIGACESRIIAFDPLAPLDVWDQDRIRHMRVNQLEELLSEADVVSLHLPLLDSTRNMIGAKELGMMKDTAILINTARGGIVNEKDLLQALRGKQIWGAVLDAVEVEPPTLDTCGELLKLDNVIITPHIGASTEEMQSQAGIAAVETLLAVLDNNTDFPGNRVI